MTPEEMEARLQGLLTPEPPERLRERCLSGRSARRRIAPGLWAAAAALLFVPLLIWVVRSPVKPPQVLTHPRPAQAISDPVLRKKCEDLLRKHPGKTVLVVRVQELRDGKMEVVRKGVRMWMLLENAAEEPDPLKDPMEAHAQVDSDGTLLYVVTPGKYRAVGYGRDFAEPMDKLFFRWEYRNFTAKANDVVLLAEGTFAPWMEWTWPVEGSTVRLSGKQKVSWKPYPQVTTVALHVLRKVKNPDGVVSRTEVGTLTFEEPQELGIGLSALRQSTPFDLGDTLELQLEGYSAPGKKLTEAKTPIEIIVKE